jgi:putative PIN family toxin of toxin-antitoxin system
MTKPEPLRAVFDCMTFLQATARPNGPAAECMRLVDGGAIALFVSDDILHEVEDVLSRPMVRRKNPLLTDQAVRRLLDRLEQTATRMESVAESISYPRDPKDEPYLNLAIAASAKYLVTRDKDLLDLMAENPEGSRFQAQFPDLKILDPVAFLREVTKLCEGTAGSGESPGS